MSSSNRHRSKKTLADILDAGEFIVIATRGKLLSDFESDRVLRNAVERNFEIIGEAMRRLETSDPDLTSSITDYRRIIDFRNVLIHGYDLVDHELVWETVKFKLPVLLTQVSALLSRVE